MEEKRILSAKHVDDFSLRLRKEEKKSDHDSKIPAGCSDVSEVYREDSGDKTEND